MKITAFTVFCLSAATCHFSHGQDAHKTSGILSDAVCGRWQSAQGDSYEFDSDGTYEHWQQSPPVSKSALAEDIDASKRTGISKGRFLVDENLLILTHKDGSSNTNKFLIKKSATATEIGKFFESGYLLTITSSDGNLARYELMYR